MKWRVRDGKSIRIWEDNWIPNALSHQPISRIPETCTITRVCELIDHQRMCWKIQLVEQLFCPQEAVHILRIPVYHQGVRYQLVWNMDKKELVIIKSAYMLAYTARKESAISEKTSHAGEGRRQMWARVWRLPINKPKLKHILWRSLHNWLAMGCAFRKRGMEVDETYLHTH